MRELLKKLRPREIANLSEQDLQQAILCGMLERSRSRIGGLVYANQAAAEIINDLAAMDDVQWPERKTLSEALERNIARALKKLEQNELIQPALGMNGAQGAVVLTAEGEKIAVNPVDHDRVRIRNSLTPQMLHPKLRGKTYDDFKDDHPTSAIQEAYKILDIAVAEAAEAKTGTKPTAGYGVNLMLQVFDHNTGALTDSSENEPTRKALARLFAGAMGRFRNKSTHTHRQFDDLYEAIEELMVCCRLLRFLDEPARK